MLKTLFVTDDHVSVKDFTDSDGISFETYLRDYPKLNEPKTRIINLCDTSRYLSQGYYCSLLAEARNHQVIPSIKVINALRNEGATLWLDAEDSCRVLPEDVEKGIVVCMGEVANPNFKRLAKRVFQQFVSPILRIVVFSEGSGQRVQVTRISLLQLAHDEQVFCRQVLSACVTKSWRPRSGGKKYRWDLALLVDPEEKVPPSNRGAISRFIKAGEKLGIHVRTITAQDYHLLGQFDALFIRETTAIDHHTYRFAREAESLGLIVMDDPDSILRCCNKVFLQDAFSYRKVPSLSSQIVTNSDENTLLMLEQEIKYPMVLKMPEGSFSKGVFKVADRAELIRVLNDLLKDSALILVQEYLFTEYDWRIGVLNGRALYACRYYMAKNHWQIYNHNSNRFFSGGFDALATFEVPGYVLSAALKAADVVGDGLYGIDIKEKDRKAFVLEVNDNPSIEHGVEDVYLGEELYMQIMSEFLRRLEARGR